MILEITERVLKFKNSPVGVTQIYKIAVDEMGLKDEIHYKIGGLTPWNGISARIYIDIRDNMLYKRGGGRDENNSLCGFASRF